jgi:hypothetical protein
MGGCTTAEETGAQQGCHGERLSRGSAGLAAVPDTPSGRRSRAAASMSSYTSCMCLPLTYGRSDTLEVRELERRKLLIRC